MELKVGVLLLAFMLSVAAGTGTGSKGTGAGTNTTHATGAGTGSKGTGAGTNTSHATGTGTGSKGTGAGTNTSHATGAGTGSKGTGAGTNTSHATGAGTGSKGTGAGTNTSHATGTGTGSKGTGAGMNTSHATGAGTGSKGTGAGTNTSHATGTGTGSKGTGAGTNTSHATGTGTGSKGTGAGTNTSHATGTGTGSKGTGAGTGSKGTGAGTNTTHATGTGTGSKGTGAGTGSKGTGAGTNTTHATGAGTGSKGTGAGTGSKGTGAGTNTTYATGAGTNTTQATGTGTNSNATTAGTNSNATGAGTNTTNATEATTNTTTTAATTSTATTAATTNTATTTSRISKSTGTTAGGTEARSTTAGKGKPTTPADNTRPNLEAARFKIELKIKVDATFDGRLKNTSSPVYKAYSREFKEKVTPVYQRIPGFLYVEVTGFYNGSVGVNHKLIIRPPLEREIAKDEISTLVHAMRNLTIYNQRVELDDPADIASFLDPIIHTRQDKCKAEGICLEGFQCIDGTTSHPKCKSPCTSDYCHNHGFCSVNVDGKRTCNCKVSGDVVYGGDRCEKETERLELAKGAIAGIAAGVGGGAILLLSIALGCMCCSRRKGKTPKKDKKEDEVALSERVEKEIYSDRQPGHFNYGADIKEEHRYTGRNDGGRGYEEWLMSNDRSAHEPSGRRRENDFRASGYSDNWQRNHGDDRRGGNDSMEPAAMFGRGPSMRSSGLGSSQYAIPDDVPPDYDDDKRQINHHPRDRSSDRPYTRMPTGQPPSRQPSLMSDSYNQRGSVYEQMNTDEAYAIKRPNIR